MSVGEIKGVTHVTLHKGLMRAVKRDFDGMASVYTEDATILPPGAPLAKASNLSET